MLHIDVQQEVQERVEPHLSRAYSRLYDMKIVNLGRANPGKKLRIVKTTHIVKDGQYSVHYTTDRTHQ